MELCLFLLNVYNFKYQRCSTQFFKSQLLWSMICNVGCPSFQSILVSLLHGWHSSHNCNWRPEGVRSVSLAKPNQPGRHRHWELGGRGSNGSRRRKWAGKNWPSGSVSVQLCMQQCYISHRNNIASRIAQNLKPLGGNLAV